MEEHLKDGLVTQVIADQQPPIDPLRRVWIPVEKRTSAGTLVFRTSDKTLYFRAPDGSIRHSVPKVNGKESRRARGRLRSRGV